MLEAYLDESGTHKGSATLSVAAWVGQQAYWKRFLSYWDNRYFHAKDPKCDPLRPALFDAIQDSRLEGFVACMKPKDYKVHVSQQFKSIVGNGYAICTFACALGISRFAQRNKLGPVAFTIEGGQPNAEYIRRVLDGMTAKPRFGIAAVTVSTKEKCVQLCTADFLAHSRTSDEKWFERFVSTERIQEREMTPEVMMRLSFHLLQGDILRRRNKKLLKAPKAQNNERSG